MYGHLLSEEGRLGAGDIDEKRDNSASNTKYIACFNFTNYYTLTVVR